jgi:hypothetical protein
MGQMGHQEAELYQTTPQNMTLHSFVDLTLLNRWGEVGVRFTG